MNTPNPSTPAEEGLWDALDCAAYLKTSRSWVYQKVDDGSLPVLRIGGLLRFEPATVKAFARGELPSAQVLPLRPRGTP